MLMTLAAGLMLVPTVVVDARDVTLGDMVRDAGGGRLRGPAAGRVVLRLPAGQRTMALSGLAAAALVRRRAGIVVAEGPSRLTIALRVPARAATGCWASARPLAAGEIVTMHDVTPVACGGDAAAIGTIAGAPVTRDSVSAGVALGRLLPAPVGRVARGAALTLRSVSGPVTIERAVTTLQLGRSGRRIFVRDGQGQVFAASLALVAEGSR